MKTFSLFSGFLLSLSLSPSNLAACSGDECVTVTGKKEVGEPTAGIAHGPGNPFPQLPKPPGTFSEPGGGAPSGTTLTDSRFANRTGKEKAEEIKKKKEEEGKINNDSIFDILLLPISAAKQAAIDAFKSVVVQWSDSESSTIIKLDPKTGKIIEVTHKEKCSDGTINSEETPCMRLKVRRFNDFMDKKNKLYIKVEEVQPAIGSTGDVNDPNDPMNVLNFFWFTVKDEGDVETFLRSLEN